MFRQALMHGFDIERPILDLDGLYTMDPRPQFFYDSAFERNLGWVTEAEQLALRGKRVAIAGMGGVGGAHLITLARLGIGAFHIADFDSFSLPNFNRQIGANLDTIGRPKLEVLQEMALAINPQLRISRFDQGVNAANLDAFLSDVDLFVDGLDFFVLDIRRKVFGRCHELRIPAITAGPIGMGTSLLAFVPDGMSFDKYFRLNRRSEHEQYLRFLIGLVPKALHRSYLVDASRFNVVTKTGPSTGAACQLCAGVAAVTALKLLLRRGEVLPAPYSHHYDAFRGVLATTRLRFGLNGPIQRIKIRLARRVITDMLNRPPPVPTFVPDDTIDEILHAARWAPSGDNEQPWRFEKLGQQAVRVHLTRRNDRNVYHYRDGEPNLLAGGMLLESLRIAASAHRQRMEWRIEDYGDPLRLHIQFIADETLSTDALYPALGERSVDRNRYRSRPLTDREREALDLSLDGQLQIDWHPGLRARWRFARLSAQATRIRLSAPETLPIHRGIIDWDTNLSPTKIPAGALGLRRSTLRIMRWGMRSLRRTQFLVRFGGTTSAAIETDYLPILSSPAVFTLRFRGSTPSSRSVEQILTAGGCIQRFWLTAARLGLALQPAVAVLIFAHYGKTDSCFTADATLRLKAQALAEDFRETCGADPDEFVFMGRIGEPLPRTNVCRSIRKPLSTLMKTPT